MKSVLKKSLAGLCAVSMAASLAACGGSGSTAAGSGEAQGGYDQVTYAYATFNNIPTQEDLDVVQEAVNAITREKINVEVKLMLIGF